MRILRGREGWRDQGRLEKALHPEPDSPEFPWFFLSYR